MPEEERTKINREVRFGIKSVTMPFWNTQGKTFETDEIKNGDNLKTFFSKNTKPDIYAEYISKAREELYIHNNYKYSFIESWTTIEVAISNILLKIKADKGISKNKIDTYEGEVGISYLLNIELLLVHSTNDNAFKELINRVDAIRKIRNKVIHYNKDISLTQAENALTTAIDFLNYFNFKKY